MSVLVEAVFQQVKDILFPLFCLSCRTEGKVLCDNCLSHFEVKGIFACPVCALSTPGGRVCRDCEGKSFLDSHFALTEYAEYTVIARLLHELKYNFIEEARLPLQKIFSGFSFENIVKEKSIDFITSVPLHPRRQAERGFNQAELLASLLANQINLPIQPVLKRVRFTRPQVGLSENERQKNIQNAFSCITSVKEKSILLVDDVYTTGSTMQECAKILKENGAREVHGFTIARALPH